MVGDTLTDIKYAKSANVIGIGVGDSKANRAILKAEADLVFKDVVDVVNFIETLKR